MGIKEGGVKDPAIIEEIEWQFSLGQSRHAAMTAVGYTNELTLARWLYRHNRPDLANIFERTTNE